jgi:hypothetical protein
MQENTVPEADPKGEEPDKEEPDELSELLSTPLNDLTWDSLTSLHILDVGIRTQAFGIASNFIDPSQRKQLRDWWHDLLREYDRFYCYGVFLMLEADTEAFKYVTEYALELNQASGKNCAILGLGNISPEKLEEFDKLFWFMTADQQVKEGNSLKIAELFHISLTRFPGLILFRDIRSSEYILVNLRGLKAEEIADKLRGVYQAINQAAQAKADPLEAVHNLRLSDEYRLKKRSIISGIRKIAGQTLETVIEAIIKTIIK